METGPPFYVVIRATRRFRWSVQNTVYKIQIWLKTLTSTGLAQSAKLKRRCRGFGFRGRTNGPLPSSKNPRFQNEAKCTTFVVKMSFICMRMKNHFHIKGWVLNLVLIQRPGGTRKWHILRVLKKLRNEGTVFALQTARQPHDHIKWQSRLQWEIKIVTTISTFMLNTLTPI